MPDDKFNPLRGASVLSYPMDGNRIMTFSEQAGIALAALRDGDAVAAVLTSGEMVILMKEDVPQGAWYPGTYAQIEAQIMRQAQQWDALWN
jgi:hypothetical protein